MNRDQDEGACPVAQRRIPCRRKPASKAYQNSRYDLDEVVARHDEIAEFLRSQRESLKFPDKVSLCCFFLLLLSMIMEFVHFCCLLLMMAEKSSLTAVLLSTYSEYTDLNATLHHSS